MKEMRMKVVVGRGRGRERSFSEVEVVKKLKRLEKSQFLQILCKCYEVVEMVTTSVIIRRVDKNVV